MKTFLRSGVALIAASVSMVALGDTTGLTGGGQPFNNQQPSLAVTQVLPLEGIFPSRDSGGFAVGGTLGFVYSFAGNFSPGSSLEAQGQLLQINTHTALFSLLGTTYGGNGITNFALPDLRGTATIGDGTGPGLSTQDLGVATGSATVTLSTAQIPPHDHTLPGGGVTGSTGGGQPFSNMQPSLPLRTVIATDGIFPSSGGGGSAAFIGQVATFAGNFAPSGWADANGQLLDISSNTALFAILGTTYGGDGMTTFALPDLRGRVAVGASATIPLGTSFGQEDSFLALSQLPGHDHTLPGGGVTGDTGGGQPVSNDQPSLALNYLIATTGIFPSFDSGSGFDANVQTLGQITEFAGNYEPGGWMFADGRLLSISTNQALFSILGTQYGGDGRTNFALPDLRGRTLVGTDGFDYIPGVIVGADITALTENNLPAHAHSLEETSNTVPEPGAIALLSLALAGLGLSRRRKLH